MLCINVTPHDHKMCDSPVSHFNLNLSDSLPNCSKTAKRDCSPGSQLDFMHEFQSDCSSLLEGSSSSAETKGIRSCSKRQNTQPYRFQLEEEVQRLRQQLEEEVELHAILENVVENNVVASSSPSCLPHHVKELLSSIAALETTVSKLEEDAVSLQFQLSQERNERRLAEYHLKHSTSHSPYGCSPENIERLNTEDSDTFIQDRMVSAQMFQHVVLGNFPNDMPFKGLWDHPNKLSEEMVRCMKNIFISLVDSSTASSKLSAPDNHCLPLSPQGNLTNISLSSASECSTSLSGVQSPRVDLQCVTDMSVVKHLSDPYRVRGKLSSADIGNYALTVEVSWMSVGKKQLEYAAGALRRFRFSPFAHRLQNNFCGILQLLENRSLVEQLAKVNPIHLNNNEKLAFWINLYNALIMHAYLAYGVPRSDLKLFSLMQKAAYTVGGHSFTAAAMEYVILKMKPPAHRPQIALLLALHKLKVPEEQRSFSIDTLEPLVVFALSCGMYSSPAVRIYTAKNVREELLEAQRDFIRASVGVSSKGKLLVPKMLHCFARGFVDDSNLAVWISHYLPSYQAAFVEQCVSKRRQRFLGSRNCGILPFDYRFRYLFLPDESTP